MDKAWLGSVDIAIKKAKTAVYFNMNTGALGQVSYNYDFFNIIFLKLRLKVDSIKT